MKRDIICIGCPLGCNLEVEIDGDKVIKVSGHTCKRGEEYGIKECTNPTRIVTSTVNVEGGCPELVSVKTINDIPKDKIVDCIKALVGVSIKAPVKIGDVIIKNAADTGVDIVATSNSEKRED